MAVAGAFATPGLSVAATINVGGGCTLAEAISNANTNSTGGGNGCAAGSGNDTIVLPAGVDQVLTAALPALTSNITLEGNGRTVRRDRSSPTFPIFQVTSVPVVEIRNTIISGGSPISDGSSFFGGGIVNFGRLTLRNCMVTGNFAYRGGGIYNNGGRLTLVNSQVSGNGSEYSGGGILSQTRTVDGIDRGSLFLVDSVVSGNTAGNNGGGIANFGPASLTGSQVSGNSASGEGGGVVNAGEFTATNSRVSNNVANYIGGGILNDSGTAFLEKSVVSENRAGGGGGGISNYTEANLVITASTISGNSARSNFFGGGILSIGNLEMTNSTVSGNDAMHSYGGGISISSRYPQTALVTNSTISGNTAMEGGGLNVAGELSLSRSPISGNFAFGDGFEIALNNQATVTADDMNLFGQASRTTAQAFSGFTPGANDIVATSNGTDPTALPDILDTELDNNGGPTQTHALASGSPAIDATGSNCLPTDQRGVPRPQGSACDIGAYELTPPPVSVAFIGSNQSVAESAGTVNLRVRLSAISGQPVTVPLTYSGVARRDSDYTGPNSISIAAGVREINIPIRIINDRTKEPNETLTVRLGTPTNATLGSVRQRSLTILKSD
ncbi:MAG: choice-of-anchor Q domain-containing protein [Panacagrimonas sp.]